MRAPGRPEGTGLVASGNGQTRNLAMGLAMGSLLGNPPLEGLAKSCPVPSDAALAEGNGASEGTAISLRT
jgi:hypothetical protein